MDNNSVYERDLLYPSETLYEPGCINVKMYSPTKEGKIPVVINSRTNHSPVKNIDAILKIMQIDILDRINVNINKNIELYIVSNDSVKEVSNGKDYIKVNFTDNEIEFVAVDSIA